MNMAKALDILTTAIPWVGLLLVLALVCAVYVGRTKDE